jgi:hypothetical protein
MRLSAAFVLALLTACGQRSSTASGAWALDHTEPGGVLVSVWGSGPHDVWAAGGQANRGLVLHGDGESWTPVATGATSLLWWIYGFGPADVYAVGEHGLILHYDGATWQRAVSGTDRTLYGLWGSSGGDVWIVDPSGQPGSGVILRGSGLAFQPVGDLPGELVPNSFFKVYGTSKHDVLVVGRGGTVLRWDGAWRRDEVPTSQAIISLWGRGVNDLYAVGGQVVGEMLHFDGATWTKVAGVSPGPELYGVFTAPGRPVFAVGAQSHIVELTPGGGSVVREAPGMSASSVLHSVWGDTEGTVYAVGGNLLDYPASMSGVILRRQ